MLETNTELENAQVFGRNQELSREWSSKAVALQDYVRKINEQDRITNNNLWVQSVHY